MYCTYAFSFFRTALGEWEKYIDGEADAPGLVEDIVRQMAHYVGLGDGVPDKNRTAKLQMFDLLKGTSFNGLTYDKEAGQWILHTTTR